MPRARRFLARALRHLLALSTAAVLLAAALPAPGAVAATRPLPPEGIFESCSLATQFPTCIARLETIHAGGFQVVVFPASGASPVELATYAGAAHSLGMSIMWAIGDQGWWNAPLSSTGMAGNWLPFAAACGCTENGQVLSYMVHWLGELPGTYGYYAADDSMLAAGDGAAVTRYVAAIKAADPAHPAILSSANENQTAQYERVGDMNASEIYPVNTSSLMPVSQNLGMWGGVAQTAADVQSLAASAGRPSVFILQGFTFGDNLSDGQAVGVCSPTDSKQRCYDELQYPTPAAQLQLRNEVLQHAHPKLILWYSFPGTYGQSGNDTYSIYPTGATAAARWAGLQAAVKAPAPSGGSSDSGSGATVAHTARASRSTTGHRRRGHHRTRRHHRSRRRHHRGLRA